jgi:hypothetical protein
VASSMLAIISVCYQIVIWYVFENLVDTVSCKLACPAQNKRILLDFRIQQCPSERKLCVSAFSSWT